MATITSSREIPTVKNVIEVFDAGDYIKPGGWNNSPEQRRMMVEYPEAEPALRGTI